MTNHPSQQPTNNEKAGGDQWMFETLSKIMGKKLEPQGPISARYKFTKLWREATEGQRLKFVEKTRFSVEVPDYKDLVKKFRDQFSQMLPPMGATRNEDIEYFLAPKI